jgi:hypothetical protein
MHSPPAPANAMHAEVPNAIVQAPSSQPFHSLQPIMMCRRGVLQRRVLPRVPRVLGLDIGHPAFGALGILVPPFHLITCLLVDSTGPW